MLLLVRQKQRGTRHMLDSGLEQRLKAYFATLRSLELKETLKRSLANWPVYAAVSGSAMAMATGASASIISNGIKTAREPSASVRLAKPGSAGSKGPPFGSTRF